MAAHPHASVTNAPARALARLCVSGAVLVATLLSAASLGARVRVLPENPRALHHVFERSSPPEVAPISFEPVDFDGDGFDELVTVSVSEMGDHWDIMVCRVTEAGRICLLSRTFFRPVGLAGAVDVDGDGTGEIVLWRQTDRDELRVDVLRVSVGSPSRRPAALIDTLGSVLVEDVRDALLPNGIWRGEVDLLDAVDLDGDGTREGLVLMASARIRGSPRGVWLADWDDEAVDWRLETGATPSGGAVLADLDGDGADEIAVGLESPGNMVRAGDWDDGRSYVVALELDGTVLWYRELGGTYGTVAVAVGDLDADGSLEVATGIGGRPEGDAASHRLVVWRGRDGSLVDEASFGVSVNCVVVDEHGGGATMLAGFGDGLLRRLSLTGGAIVEEAGIDCGSAVDAVRPTQFDPTRGQWTLLVTTADGVIALVDEDLAPVAVLPTGDYGRGQREPLRAARFETDDGAAVGALVGTGQTLHFLRLARNPVPLGWWAGIVIGASAALVLAVPALRRDLVGAARRLLVRGAEREAAIDALLDKLARAGHGKLKATSTFRRLREQLALLSSHEGEPPAGFDQRFRQAVANSREIGIAAVLEIATDAGELGLARRAAPRLVRDVAGLRKLIEGLSGGPPDASIASTLRKQIDELLPSITDGLERVGFAARFARSSSLGAELSRVIDSWGDECRRRGITLDAPDAARYRDTRVLVSCRELTFILDNLIDNAVRAVRARKHPRIAISVEADVLTAVIAVADNGSGIPTEHHDEIFRRGVSEKPAGGSGLPASRGLLENRGGDLRLVRSTPSEGTIFEVRLQVVQSPETKAAEPC